MKAWCWQKKRDHCLLNCLVCLQENILGGFFSLWKTEELLWQINCGVEKTAAVDLSDISLDANIPEGDACDLLANLFPASFLVLLLGNVSLQQSCVFVGHGFMLCGWVLVVHRK